MLDLLLLLSIVVGAVVLVIGMLLPVSLAIDDRLNLLSLLMALVTSLSKTLNLLRASRQDPKKSAYASLDQAFDWN